MSALHFSIAAGHVSVAVLLLEFTADIEHEAVYTGVPGRRPVHIAAREGLSY